MTLSTESALRKDKRTSRSAELQHRHFAFIADVLANLPNNAFSRGEVIDQFANACRRTNSNFDYDRFIRACNDRG